MECASVSIQQYYKEHFPLHVISFLLLLTDLLSYTMVIQTELYTK